MSRPTLTENRATRTCALLVCLLALLAGLGSIALHAARSSAAVGSAATASASSPVYVNSRSQPARLPIKQHGAYRHLSVHDLVWVGWGQPQAKATGVFTYQFCLTERCSVSPFYDVPAVVRLSAIKRCGARRSYTTLALTVEGSTPDSSFKGFRMSVATCPKRSPSAR